MASLERTITVQWCHQIHFTQHAFAPANPLLKQVLQDPAKARPPKILAVLDGGLAKASPALPAQVQAYLSAAANLVCPPLIMESGERIKNAYFHVSELHSQIDLHHLDRHSYLVAVGGGALLDMAGLAAATAHRGIRLIRVPSTTLSQADSGVGVKNGINAFGKKNFIGVFAPPFAVVNDFALLASLSPREKRAGYAEAVKVACIRDAKFFDDLERHAAALCQFAPDVLEHTIRRCAELHVDHIAYGGDPFENGSARPLDFGHWSAHKLEQMSGFAIRHGEAVALGMALDVLYAREIGLLAPPACERILNLLETLGFDLFANEMLHADSEGRLLLLQGLEEFREHLGGELTITLLAAIGRGIEVHTMDERVVASALRLLEARWQNRAAARDDFRL